MKKLLLLVLAITLSTGVFAQPQLINSNKRNDVGITEKAENLVFNIDNSFSKRAIKTKKNTNEVNETVFGANDMMLFSSYDTSVPAFYYSNMFSRFSDGYGYNVGFVEKYYTNTPLKISAGLVYFYAEKVANPNDTVYFIVYDKDLKMVDGSYLTYAQCKMNNEATYPNYGKGVTKFELYQPITVSDTFYLSIMFNSANNVNALTGDSIFVYSSKHGVRKYNYPNQNYVINYDGNELYLADIKTQFELETNLWIGALVENPACNNFTADAGNDVTVCSGDSVLLKATYTGNFTEPVIIGWSDTLYADHNYTLGNNIKGPVTSSKKVYLTVFDTINNCIAYDSILITVKTDCNPNVCDVTASINKVENANDITLTALPAVGVTYKWNNNATTQSITVNKPASTTTYSVTVTKIGTTCTASASVVITPTGCDVTASINKVENANDITLTALPAVGVTYKWNNNATTQSITVNKPVSTTTYSVTVTKIGTTCTASASVVITPTGLVSLEDLNSSLIVYPMPINEVLNVKFNAANDNSTTISIIDIMGRVIYTEDVKATGTVNKNINTEKFANGIYTLKIATANGNVMRKIIKN